MNKKKKLIFTLVFIAFILAIVFICWFRDNPSIGSSIRMNYSGNETRYYWSGKYKYFGGDRVKKMHVKNNSLSIEVETKEGEISIEVEDMDGNVLFSEKCMETSTYKIDTPEIVKVHIVADAHKGRFKIQSSSYMY